MAKNYEIRERFLFTKVSALKVAARVCPTHPSTISNWKSLVDVKYFFMLF